MYKIFLDMDGVIADFVGGALRLTNSADPYVQEHNKGKFDVFSLLSPPMTETQFWSKTNYDFWRTLQKTKEADELVGLLTASFGGDAICVLTKPGPTFGCHDAKRDWLREHFPSLSDRLLCASAKHFCAHPSSILIDDNESNVRNFASAGGHAILFPRPWNSFHSQSFDPVAEMKKQLKFTGV